MSFVWYTKKDTSVDLVHQTLAYGTLLEVKALKKTIGAQRLTDLFLHYPKKVYTASGLNFIKKFILQISSSLDDQKYLKNTPRNTR